MSQPAVLQGYDQTRRLDKALQHADFNAIGCVISACEGHSRARLSLAVSEAWTKI
jgi:hypothetical protein